MIIFKLISSGFKKKNLESGCSIFYFIMVNYIYILPAQRVHLTIHGVAHGDYEVVVKALFVWGDSLVFSLAHRTSC